MRLVLNNRYIRGMAFAAAAVFMSIAVWAAQPALAYAEENISVYVNGEKLNFDVAPQTINDRTMVPMRTVFEALGAEVIWNGDHGIITAVKGATKLHLTVGSDIMMKNLIPIKLDAGAMLLCERTLIPVRAVSKAFGCTVEWDGETSSVLINQVSE